MGSWSPIICGKSMSSDEFTYLDMPELRMANECVGERGSLMRRNVIDKRGKGVLSWKTVPISEREALGWNRLENNIPSGRCQGRYLERAVGWYVRKTFGKRGEGRLVEN